eukprot:3708322-Rhodomonas_salina.1
MMGNFAAGNEQADTDLRSLTSCAGHSDVDVGLAGGEDADGAERTCWRDVRARHTGARRHQLRAGSQRRDVDLQRQGASALLTFSTF